MNIGIDIDDTISKTFEIVCELAKKYNTEELKRNEEINLNKDITSPIWCKELFEWNEDEENNFWKKYYLKYIEEVEVKEKARETIKKLAKDNNIILITARFDDNTKKAEKVTKKWLEKNEIKYNKLFMGHLDKRKIAQENQIDIFIDDNFSTCKEIADLEIKTFMMDSKLNKGKENKNITRVKSWTEIEQLIFKYENIIDVVGTMFFDNKKLLIDKPRKRQTFQMVGGKVEQGETPLQAAIRECHEELGTRAIFDEKKIEFVMDFIEIATSDKNQRIHMHIFKYEGKLAGELITSNEIEKFMWFGKNDDKNILSNTLKNEIIPYAESNNLI